VSQIVNRRDLQFLLFEFLELERFFARSRYQNFNRDTIETILDTAQAIAERLYLPCAAALDATEPEFVDGKVSIAPQVGEALAAYAEAGFFGAAFDESLGGLQLPYAISMAVNGMFMCANVGIANYALLSIANANMLNTFGTPEQKARFLPPMLSGRWFGTMCLSEPQAGSSLSDIRTRAEASGDGEYRITGTKMWISGGDHDLSENIVHMVLARIAGGPPGAKGLSLFIVPKYRLQADGSLGEWNHVALAGLNHKMGQRGTTNCLLNFGETGTCLGYLVGEPHQGLHYMFHMMNEARIVVGVGSTMSGLAGYLYSLDYARTRRQGRPVQDKNPLSPQILLIEHADIKRMLMAQKAAVEGAGALCAFCALLVDRKSVEADMQERRKWSLLLEILTPIAKSWPSEHCLEANKVAIQVLGGYGYTREYPVERFYRDNRLNHIHEGAFGIQGLDLLGRKVRMEDGEALKILLAQISATIDEAKARILQTEAASLGDAVDALSRATRAVLECTDPALGLANATIYLDAFGHVVIAWIWLWQAVKAQIALDRQDAPVDRAFYEGKVAACRYFFRYELPLVHPRFAQVGSLDDTCLRLAPEQFVGI